MLWHIVNDCENICPIKLQDTLMQREEELARLQEENNKLKEFLNSSYVKSLEEKTKVRNLTS